MLIQVAADDVFHWHRGWEMPSLCPVTEEIEEKQMTDEEKEEKEKETDADVLKQDLIKVNVIKNL